MNYFVWCMYMGFAIVRVSQYSLACYRTVTRPFHCPSCYEVHHNDPTWRQWSIAFLYGILVGLLWPLHVIRVLLKRNRKMLVITRSMVARIALDGFLKLCVVLLVVTTGFFMSACPAAQTDYALARGWAGAACSFVQALPEAQTSAFPADKQLTMTVTSGSIQAVVSASPSSASSTLPTAYERKLP